MPDISMIGHCRISKFRLFLYDLMMNYVQCKWSNHTCGRHFVQTNDSMTSNYDSMTRCNYFPSHFSCCFPYQSLRFITIWYWWKLKMLGSSQLMCWCRFCVCEEKQPEKKESWKKYSHHTNQTCGESRMMSRGWLQAHRITSLPS